MVFHNKKEIKELLESILLTLMRRAHFKTSLPAMLALASSTPPPSSLIVAEGVTKIRGSVAGAASHALSVAPNLIIPLLSQL